MEVLSCKKLSEIKGGGAVGWIIAGGILTILAGIFSGLINPSPCKVVTDED